MLVLSRKIGERVFIGNDIAVMVVDVRGDRVRLGFECPAGIRVLREELRRHEELYQHHGEEKPFAELAVTSHRESCYALLAD